jgi:hypothetical protein
MEVTAEDTSLTKIDTWVVFLPHPVPRTSSSFAKSSVPVS